VSRAALERPRVWIHFATILAGLGLGLSLPEGRRASRDGALAAAGHPDLCDLHAGAA